MDPRNARLDFAGEGRGLPLVFAFCVDPGEQRRAEGWLLLIQKKGASLCILS